MKTSINKKMDTLKDVFLNITKTRRTLTIGGRLVLG